MARDIKNQLILVIVLFLSTAWSSLPAREPDKTVTLETMPKATLGFPSILKVTVTGPRRAYGLSLYENGMPLIIHLKSQSDGAEYTIKSKKNDELIYAIQDAGQAVEMTEKFHLHHEIPNGQKCTMLFDLWSLQPTTGSKTSLADIPPGNYTIYVEPELKPPSVIDLKELFPEDEHKADNEFNQRIDLSKFYKNTTTNTVDLELVAPTSQERYYLQQIQRMAMQNQEYGISWVDVLRRKFAIPDDGISLLTQLSKEQLSLHKLLSNINAVDIPSREKAIQDVNSASLPEYFEPERQLLLFELKGKPVDELGRLLNECPGYSWNIKNDRIAKELLRFRIKPLEKPKQQAPDIPQEQAEDPNMGNE